MHVVMQALVELQNLEFGKDNETPASKEAAEKLRTQVPRQIMGHYDRLRANGKKGVALVRGKVCSECHMQIPLGTIMTIMKGEDIQLCGNCGRYLYVEPTAAPEAAPAVTEAKPKRGRKPKAKADENVA